MKAFIYDLLNLTTEDATSILVNGALFTFSVIAFFAVLLNFGWFPGIVTAVTMSFVAAIVNQHITNFFERHETENSH